MLEGTFISRTRNCLLTIGLLLPMLKRGLCQSEVSCAETALGMNSGLIPDRAISASSSYDESSVGPHNARIRTERNGGAWCPRRQIMKDIYEWLEVDFGELKLVARIETQGRFGNGQGQEYAEAYVLEYQRVDGGPWFRFRNRKGDEVFIGNSNTYAPEKRDIDPPIVARRMRVIPYSNHPRTVCMRVELYGCKSKAGLVAYNMRQGDRRGTEIDLYDFTYDGRVQDGLLSDGLGQLVDGEEGPTNFRLGSPYGGSGKKGYQWVGWRNDLTESGGGTSPAFPGGSGPIGPSQASPVEIIFVFDSVRNFTEARFHANNQYTKDVRVFSRAKLYFSVGGRYYQPRAVVYDYMRDTVIDLARQVIVQIPNRVGKYLKVELYFDARWMLISEVNFESEIATGNYSEELAPPSPDPTSLITKSVESRSGFSLTRTGGTGVLAPRDAGSSISDLEELNSNPDPFSHDSKSFPSDHVIGIIIGALLALILLFGAIAFVIVRSRQRRKFASKENQNGGAVLAGHNMAANGVGVAGNARHYVAINLRNLRALTTKNGGVTSSRDDGDVTTSSSDQQTQGPREGSEEVPLCRSATAKQQKQQVQPQSNNANLCNGSAEIFTPGAKMKYQNGFTPYQDPRDGVQGRDLPDLPRFSESAMDYNTGSSRGYAVPELVRCSTAIATASPPRSQLLPYNVDNPNATEGGCFPSAHPPVPPPPPLPRAFFPDGKDGEEGPAPLPSCGLQGSMGNSLYSVPNSLDLLGGGGGADDLQLIEFPRENLKFVDKLGEGQFGEVHLCEALQASDCLDADCSDPFLLPILPPYSSSVCRGRSGSRSILVAVKTLRPHADQHARTAFHREVRMLSRLKDANIVQVLGVCSEDEPLCIIVEYMRFGDLHQFLRAHVLQEGATVNSRDPRALSYGCLVYMATQIASGMKYLEALNMVHRDLAARNCLVGDLFSIKISDFGMSRSLYTGDYYRIDGRVVLPIRWMAWESIFLGKFSTKSDVWSFGVTLWEILTLAREQPFDALTNEHVIENSAHYYHDDGDEAWPPQPISCPKEIYDLMRECWNRDEAYRPTFREVHMFLQRKNMGYSPREEAAWTIGVSRGGGTGGRDSSRDSTFMPMI